MASTSVWHNFCPSEDREVIEGLEGVINIGDDILVFGRGETYSEAAKDHDANLIALLQRARERNLKLNPKKFKLKQMLFMGHQVKENGLIIDDSKIRAIRDMPVPKDKKGVQ